MGLWERGERRVGPDQVMSQIRSNPENENTKGGTLVPTFLETQHVIRPAQPACLKPPYQTAKMKTSALLCAFVASASAFAPQQQVAARAPALNGVPLANGKFHTSR